MYIQGRWNIIFENQRSTMRVDHIHILIKT